MSHKLSFHEHREGAPDSSNRGDAYGSDSGAVAPSSQHAQSGLAFGSSVTAGRLNLRGVYKPFTPENSAVPLECYAGWQPMRRRDLLAGMTLAAGAAEAQEPPAPSLYIPKAHLVDDRALLHDFMALI